MRAFSGSSFVDNAKVKMLMWGGPLTPAGISAGESARLPMHNNGRSGLKGPAVREGKVSPASDDFLRVLRLATELLPTGVLVIGPDGAIVLANQQSERQFAYERDQLIGRPVDLLLPGSLPREDEDDREPVSERTVLGRRSDGSEFPVEIELNPVGIGETVFMVASVVDVTAQRELERAASVAVDRKLEFERLMAELSIKFINEPPDQVIEAIRDGIRLIGESLDVDRCTFFRVPDGDLQPGPIAWWGRPGINPPIPTTPLAERFPDGRDTILAGNVLSFSRLDEVVSAVDREGYESCGIQSAVTVPISVAGRIVGALSVHMLRDERSWSDDTLHTLHVVAAVFASILARSESDDTLRQAILQIEHTRDRVRVESAYLRREVQERTDTGVIIGQSQAIRSVLEQARQVAATDSTVLLLGETGTGKELIATHIHELSARRGRVMVRVNCSAIPSTLMESELFGREKGAFTGALARQIGRFELADHSTIFLDEIGELPSDVQIKLLRVLEERQIERLGSPKGVHVDVRIIAATHRDLEKRIGDGAFREDLFYRLNVFPIVVPPLRERVEDIPLLVWRFVDEFSKAFGKRIEVISREDMAVLQAYAWPGNIRELRNVVERAMIVSTGAKLSLPLPSVSRPAGKRSLKLHDVEKEHILSVLDSAGWRIRGAAGAADLLGLKPTTLEARMAKLGLTRPKHH
jgi:formate hydrogenlyase transcriptional activator